MKNASAVDQAVHRSQSFGDLRGRSQRNDDQLFKVKSSPANFPRTQSVTRSAHQGVKFKLPASRDVPAELRNKITAHDYADLPSRVAESKILDALPHGLGVRSERTEIHANSELSRLVRDYRTPSAVKKEIRPNAPEEIKGAPAVDFLSDFDIPYNDIKITGSCTDLNKSADLCLKLLHQANKNPNSHAKQVINEIKRLIKPGVASEAMQREMLRQAVVAQRYMHRLATWEESDQTTPFDRTML